MPNPDEGIAQPRFYCGIPRCSPCFAMMLQILAVKSALCTGLPPRRLVGHGRPKTCLLNACTCEGTRARPGFSNSNARSTYTPCAWRKQDRASSLQELNRPPGQVPSGGIYAFDVRQTLTPYLLPWLLLLEATSFWLSLSLTLSLSLLLSFSLDLSLSLWASTVCPDMNGPGTTEFSPFNGPGTTEWACLGSQATMFKCVGCAEHSKTQESKTHTLFPSSMRLSHFRQNRRPSL